MAKTILNNVEKLAIQGGLSASKSVEEIAKELGRQKRTVQKYIDGELNDIHETIAKIQLEQAEQAELEQEQAIEYLSEAEEIEIKTKEALKKERIEQAVEQALKQSPPPKKVNRQRKRKPAANTGIATRKEKGVAIMTEAGSAISDAIQERQKKDKTISRTARGNMYLIDEEEVV